MPDDPGGSAASKAEARVTIVNERGLHARASRKFVLLAAEFDAAVTIAKADGPPAAADSIMDVLMLVAGPGSEVTIRAVGREAPQAVAALQDLVASGFGE